MFGITSPHVFMCIHIFKELSGNCFCIHFFPSFRLPFVDASSGVAEHSYANPSASCHIQSEGAAGCGSVYGSRSVWWRVCRSFWLRGSRGDIYKKAVHELSNPTYGNRGSVFMRLREKNYDNLYTLPK